MTEEERKMMQTPEEHRLEAELRVCDPFKADQTTPIERPRVEHMAKELFDGFETLKRHKLAATFFGSSRCSIGDEIYKAAETLAGKLSKSGFTVITGGGGGVMEAANKGAFEAGGESIGLNIRLPNEQKPNTFTTESKTFNYFFSRKVMLTFASEVYVYFPGGFGTLDEFFEILTLIQTQKIKKLPIILFGKDYWEPLVTLICTHLAEDYRTISPADTLLFTVVDSVDEAYEEVLKQVKC